MKRRTFLIKFAVSALGLSLFPRRVRGGEDAPKNSRTGEDVTEIKTKFTNPKAICLDAAGNLYVGCCGWFYGMEKYRKSNSGDSFDKAWVVGKIKPRGIALQSNGNICATTQSDSGSQEIEVFDPEGKLLNHWGSAGTEDGQFCGPTGIVANAANELYVVESSKWGQDGPGHRVQKFSPEGKFLLKWGSEGTSPGQFNLPTGMALDRQQNVYVMDSNNCRVQKFSAEGKFLTAWGGYGSADGLLNCPQGIAIDSAGNILIADTFNNRIQQFTAKGDFVAKWGRQGSDKGGLWLPCGIAVDDAGTVYVADTMNNRVQIFRHSVKGS